MSFFEKLKKGYENVINFLLDVDIVKVQFIEKIDEFVRVKEELQASDCYDEHLSIGALERDLNRIGQGYDKTDLVIKLVNLIPNGGLTPEEIKRIISLF